MELIEGWTDLQTWLIGCVQKRHEPLEKGKSERRDSIEQVEQYGKSLAREQGSYNDIVGAVIYAE